ncbi:hypothetical protein Tco_0913708 [Tanacetum coccineum]
MIVDIEDDIMDPVMQCTTLPSHSGFSQKKLVSFVTEIHTLSIDISLRDWDFNEVRYASERHGSSFHASNAAEFNNFIVKSYLNDVSLGGYSFTWSNKYSIEKKSIKYHDRKLLHDSLIEIDSRLDKGASLPDDMFSAPKWIRVPFDAHFPRRLDNDQSYDLESDVTNKEIKRAVGDYGFDKSPNPDGFTFEFFKKF